MKNFLCFSYLILSCWICASSSAHAQALPLFPEPEDLFEVYAEERIQLGEPLLAIGGPKVDDWDGDGVRDQIITLVEVVPVGVPSGEVRVVSTRTLQTIRVFPWPWLASISAAPIADVDQDGHQDLVIGSSQASLVQVHSGRAGGMIGSVPITSGQIYNAASVLGLDDIDGDMVPDFAVGSPFGGANRTGVVEFFSGATFALIGALTGTSRDDGFGIQLYELGDIDADGSNDFAIVAHYEINNTGGYVSVRSTQTLQELYRLNFNPADHIVGDVLSIPDLDGDNITDIAWSIVSDIGVARPGQVRLISGRTGGEFDRLIGGQRGTDIEGLFGSYLRLVPDFDRDGGEDLLIGSAVSAFPSQFGAQHIISLESREVLFKERYPNSMGAVYEPIPDVTGDSRSDFILIDSVAGSPGQITLSHRGFDRAQASRSEASAAAGFRLTVAYDYGVRQSGKLVCLLGSLTDNLGTGSFQIGGVRIPLVPDAYTTHTFSNPGSYCTVLDAAGLGRVQLHVPPGVLSPLVRPGFEIPIQHAPVIVSQTLESSRLYALETVIHQ